MDEYTKYLATKVINEDHTINYRQLSRALKVHTHTAKQMLYDFHAKQTARKPGSIHATYLISGILQADPSESQTIQKASVIEDDDVPMESSPFPSSMVEPYPSLSFESEAESEPAEESVQATTIILVKEEGLNELKATFRSIHTIFVYSIAPCASKDFVQLRQCNRDMVKDSFWTVDPLQTYPNLGLIVNQAVRRRSGKRPIPSASAVTAPTKEESTKPIQANGTLSKTAISTQDAVAPTSTKPKALRRQSSDLFKSFAKSQPPKLTSATSNATTASVTTSLADDNDNVEMHGMSEDEVSEIDEKTLEEEAQKAEASRRARKDKEDKLRAMMDVVDDDQDMEDADIGEPIEARDDAVALDKAKQEEEEEGEKDQVTVSNGRRRGRRRVLKKRTFKDEDGYLVTKEEPAWESFSEDEPIAKKPKVVAVPSKSTKKAGPAPRGQGNLMAFFKKK